MGISYKQKSPAAAPFPVLRPGCRCRTDSTNMVCSMYGFKTTVSTRHPRVHDAGTVFLPIGYCCVPLMFLRQWIDQLPQRQYPA